MNNDPRSAAGAAPLHLVNLTPHDVVLELGEGEPLRIPASGAVPRLLLSDGRRGSLRVADPARPDDPDGARQVPLAVGAAWLGLEPPLPEPEPGTLYITSRAVAEHFPDRTDLVWPDGLVRDAEGAVVAARRLGCLHAVG